DLVVPHADDLKSLGLEPHRRFDAQLACKVAHEISVSWRLRRSPHLPIALQWAPSSPTRGEEIALGAPNTSPNAPRSAASTSSIPTSTPNPCSEVTPITPIPHGPLPP